jgi:poly(A) polymerase
MSTGSSQREFAVDVVRRLRDNGHTALFAGGCVRDLLLGRPAKDYDVATTATPDQVRALFGRKQTLPVGAAFGVIIVLGPREAGQVEVATFRTEGPYEDGRRPSSVAFCTPQEDARRRDFTINGMFYDPVDAQVLDFVGGEADLAARVVRAIGDPHERVREDKLRMLRAVRFAATLDFSLDETTAAAIREMAADLIVVSAERIAQELKKFLVDPHRRRAVELCESVDLLPRIIPELNPELTEFGVPQPTPHEITLRMLDLLQKPSFELAFAVLLHSLPARPAVHDVCRRLKLSNDEIDRITWLVDHQLDLADAPSLPLSRLKRTLAHPYHLDLINLLRVRLLATESSLQPVLFCDEYLLQTPSSVIDPPPLLTGDTLKSLGMKPGPVFRDLLESVRDAQLNDQIFTTDEAVDLIKRLTAN